MVMQKIDTEETERILNKHKIPQPTAHVAKSKKEAITYSKRMGFPIVMKINSSKIIHKSDIGGVKTNLQNEYEVGKAYEEIIKKTPESKPEGVLIQKMHKGHKLIMGMKRDEQFGPVIAFGLGGIYVEIFDDISLRIAPITRKDCLEMMKETKTYPLLTGARGSEKANINKIADILMKVSRLSLTEHHIRELDFNPVIANKKEAIVVDARLLKDES